MFQRLLVNKPEETLFTYLARTLPHVLHISVRHVWVRCGHRLVQLFGRINTEEQDQRLMSKSLNTER